MQGITVILQTHMSNVGQTILATHIWMSCAIIYCKTMNQIQHHFSSHDKNFSETCIKIKYNHKVQIYISSLF